jgi:hypothetical protein
MSQLFNHVHKQLIQFLVFCGINSIYLKWFKRDQRKINKLNFINTEEFCASFDAPREGSETQCIMWEKLFSNYIC